MRQQDFEAFSEVVVGFAELKGKQLSPAAIKLYWNAMRHWDLEEFRAAANELLRRCEFMPTPKDFEDLRKAGRLTAPEAWERARAASGSAIQCGHVTHNGSCGDELIDRAVRGIGGYGAIAMCDRDKLPFLERRFTEAYQTIQDAHEIREALPELAPDPMLRLPRQRTIFEPLIARDQPRLPGPAQPQPQREPAPVRDTQADIRKLAATGLSPEDIAKVLTQRHVTVEEIRRALEVAA